MRTSAVIAISVFALVATGCSSAIPRGGGDPPDLASASIDLTLSPEVDGAGIHDDDLGGGGGLNECGDNDPTCQGAGFDPLAGTPFPLTSDPMRDPRQGDDGLKRDPSGYLTLDSQHASFQYMWIANSNDWGRGSVSKIDSKTVREVARYLTVTCGSLKAGSKADCDGTKGCCSFDDVDRYRARVNKTPQPGHQGVQLRDLSPSRTAVDFNGDVWIANRSFSGQSSVTRIANDLSECVDRNRNGRIDTSKDTSGDGQIATDCNGDGQPDDLDGVKAKPCSNGLPPEFLGLDDECVLFTTNTNAPNQYGRPLALGGGAGDAGATDAWAGTYMDGKFFRIDSTGLTRADVQLPQGCQPYGLTIDAAGIGWAPNLGEGLCYFDTRNPKNTGKTRLPQNPTHGAYGVSMDRDQNVWTGGWTQGNAYRYTPDRTNGFANLGNGNWTIFTHPGQNAGANGNGRGIALDSRTANTYYAWMARDDGYVVRIDASKTPPPKGQDLVVDASAMPAARVQGSQTIGVGVDSSQNLWGISYTGSVATRILVNKQGDMTAPDLNSPPKGNNKCPAGDTCPLRDQQQSDPSPYTYSDFTGFGLRNFTRPRGTYSYVFQGCTGAGLETRWVSVTYDADVPPNTGLGVQARAGTTPVPDQTWGGWTMPATLSPADLADLAPNRKDSGYLQVQLNLSTQSASAAPKVKSLTVHYECVSGVG